MLSPKLLEILRAYWKAAHPKEWLFPGAHRGQPITREAVEDACQKAHRCLRPIQACHTAFATPRLCGTFARVWHRRPDHSAAARSSQPGYHRQVLANRYQQGLRHVQPAGPAAASGSRRSRSRHRQNTSELAGGPRPGRKSRMCSAATAKPIVSTMAPRYALHSVAS